MCVMEGEVKKNWYLSRTDEVSSFFRAVIEWLLEDHLATVFYSNWELEYQAEFFQIISCLI